MADGAIIISGGGGALAGVIASYFSNEERVFTPHKNELDVTSAESVNQYFSNKACELLICCAGVTHDATLAKATEEEWNHTLAVNLTGAALCAKAASKSMLKARSGHIIFISSQAAFHPVVGQLCYATAKAGLTGLTRSLALELGAANIRVNAILPGFLENRMTAHVSEKRKHAVVNEHALKRLNTENQVAEFIITLHKKLIHTSGQIFQLDSRLSNH